MIIVTVLPLKDTGSAALALLVAAGNTANKPRASNASCATIPLLARGRLSILPPSRSLPLGLLPGFLVIEIDFEFW
jgi:hypothetical protein